MVSTFIERSILFANVRTQKIVSTANEILKTGSVNPPREDMEMPRKMVITAPTDAPEETPNV